jgi:two-component system sensor histidine kinase BaeS
VRSQDELGELATSFNLMSAELERSNELRQRVTADIAHDLRTPLSIILGHTEALNEGVLPPTEEALYIIHDEARRLNRLVDDLRTLTLAEAGEMQLTRRLVEPRALLERTALAHTPGAGQAEIDLRMEADSDLPEVEVDPDRMAQVLDNLLDNALRYTPAGGHISLSAHSLPGNIRIVVQDSGPGVAPEELSRIFERFYRTNKSRGRGEGGSGLGLAIARSIVTAHGGRISAESEPGQGLSFIIDLPVGVDYTEGQGE